jgi:hypothetical protein
VSAGSTLLKGGNAAQLVSLLSGESDMSSMLTLLPQLMESGNYKVKIFSYIYITFSNRKHFALYTLLYY